MAEVHREAPLAGGEQGQMARLEGRCQSGIFNLASKVTQLIQDGKAVYRGRYYVQYRDNYEVGQADDGWNHIAMNIQYKTHNLPEDAAQKAKIKRVMITTVALRIIALTTLVLGFSGMLMSVGSVSVGGFVTGLLAFAIGSVLFRDLDRLDDNYKERISAEDFDPGEEGANYALNRTDYQGTWLIKLRHGCRTAATVARATAPAV